MKLQYIVWTALYLGLAGFFFIAFNAPADLAIQAKHAITGITWCRIVSFVIIGIVMEMSWYQPRHMIFNAARMFGELAIMVGLWQVDRPSEALASLIAIVVYEMSRQRVRYTAA